jgi:diguanylate cyclase (GGDEF)-like protein
MILSIISYVLAALTAGISALGLINGLGDDFDASGALGLVLPLLALGFIMLNSFRASPRKPGVHWFVWPVAFVLLARTMFTAPDYQDVYAALLVVAVLLPAIVRAEPVWLVVFVFASVGYPAQLAFEEKPWLNHSPDARFYIDQLSFAGIALFAGLIPWLILRRRDQTQEKEFNRTLEEVRNNAITDAMARTRELSHDGLKKSTDQMATGKIATGSYRLDGGPSSAESFALPSVGGDAESLQMKSMLFFMRHNFKALTACAFTYDPAKRALVLNSFDTKGGTQVVEKTQVPLGAGIVGSVANDKNTFMSGDIALYQGNEHSYYAQAQSQSICSIIAAPILAEGTKELLGVLVVDSPNKNAFSEHDKDQMRRFSIIAAALIQNIRMNGQLKQDAETFRVFYEVSHKFSSELRTEGVFKVLTDWIPKIVSNCTRLIIVLYNEEKGSLCLNTVAGQKGELTEGMEFSPESGGIYSYVFNKRTPVNEPDFHQTFQLPRKGYRFVPQEQPSPSTRSLLVLPIMGGEERGCNGLFSIESNVPGLFVPKLQQTVTTILENASVAITRSLLYMKMEKLATTDGLTGLNNHRTFQEIVRRELERATRYQRPLSLLLTDIDHFKSFNDTYGHPVGDLVLREIANCIKNAVRLNDFPARYGGEEFAVVLPETPEQGGMVIAERIRQAVEQKVIMNGTTELRVTISIGCVTYPTYGTTQQEIIDCADKALYASKKGGRNRVTFYNPGMTVSGK